MRDGTPASYAHKGTGFAVTAESALRTRDVAKVTCGVTTEQVLTFCATVLLGRYRRRLAEVEKLARQKQQGETQQDAGSDEDDDDDDDDDDQ